MTPLAATSDDLGGPLLASVSRSFYLSIRVLPRAIQAPIGLAYLLARASDTIADSTTAPAADRRAHLANFLRMLRTGKTAGLSELQNELHAESPAEAVLLKKLDRCLEELARSERKDRGEIVDVLEKIIRGQTLDLERFGETHGIIALKTAAELEEYTYLVAGCVGEFWTRTCLHHLPDCARLGLSEMRALGVRFGQGLQLVNILRDFPADLRDGRCYLPEDELRAAGTSAHPLADAPEKAQAVFDRWRGHAAEFLEDGFFYTRALKNLRIRAACFLPWRLGVKTLDLLAAPEALHARKKIKVPRRTVHQALALAIPVAFSNCVLGALVKSTLNQPNPMTFPPSAETVPSEQPAGLDRRDD